MMRLAVVTTGTLFGRVTLQEGDSGLVVSRDLLEVLGVRDGDELEVHTDGRMLILLPVAPEGDGREEETPRSR